MKYGAPENGKNLPRHFYKSNFEQSNPLERQQQQRRLAQKSK
jgi:hypothetical protein